MWKEISQSKDFKKLISRKVKFLVPVIIFSLSYYFALPLSVGYLPIMKTKAIGSINLAYLFALSQFFVAWLVAAAYSYVASHKFDPLAEKIRQKDHGGKQK